MLNAGDFKYPVSIESNTPGADNAMGEPGTAVWSEFVARRAKWDRSGGRRWFADPNFLAESSEVFVVRLCSTTKLITPAMRLIFKGRTLGIDTALIDHDDRVVVLACREVRNDVE